MVIKKNIVYKLFLRTSDGLLKPYGIEYTSFDTIDDALNSVDDEGVLIIPVSQFVYDW